MYIFIKKNGSVIRKCIRYLSVLNDSDEFRFSNIISKTCSNIPFPNHEIFVEITPQHGCVITLLTWNKEKEFVVKTLPLFLLKL